MSVKKARSMGNKAEKGGRENIFDGFDFGWICVLLREKSVSSLSSFFFCLRKLSILEVTIDVKTKQEAPYKHQDRKAPASS